MLNGSASRVYKNKSLLAIKLQIDHLQSCHTTQFHTLQYPTITMYGKALAGSALVVALSAIQPCPAPPIAIAIGIGIGAPLAGNLIVSQQHWSHGC